MNWLEQCRPEFGTPDRQAYWSKLINELKDSTFVEYVNPTIGKAIILSAPVQVNTKHWSEYLAAKEARLSRIAVNILKENYDPAQLKQMNNLFSMIYKIPPDTGGVRDDTKRLFAIAEVMQTEMGARQ
jgi:hypothetical protein